MLIDTRAEENLIRKGLLPAHQFVSARKVLNLVRANGQPLQGGKRTVDLNLAFRQFTRGYEMPQERTYDATFYEADIKVDAILSYPWLCENGIGLFPHHHALCLDHPDLLFLYGAESPSERQCMGPKQHRLRRRPRRSQQRVREVNVLFRPHLGPNELMKFLKWT